MPSNTDPNFDRLFLSNHSSTNSCVMETAQEMTRTSQNQREVIFDLPRPPTPGTGPLQTIPHPRARKAGLVPGLPEGMVTGQIEPCIKRKTGIVQLIIVSSSFLCRL